MDEVAPERVTLWVCPECGAWRDHRNGAPPFFCNRPREDRPQTEMIPVEYVRVSAPSPADLEAAVEALAAMVPVRVGCTCRWDEYGNPPPDCRCPERSRRHAEQRARKMIEAALPHLSRSPSAEAVEALREAAQGLSEAWNAWMTDEEGEGQHVVEAAVGDLREALARLEGERDG